MSDASFSARSASIFSRPSVRSRVRASRAWRRGSAMLSHRWPSFVFTASDGSSAVAAARLSCISFSEPNRENRPSRIGPPAVMISSCSRWLSPPMTTSRAWATTARCCKARVGHDASRHPVQPLATLQRPDLGPQQPQAHLHEPVVQVDEDDVFPPLGQGVVEDEGTHLLPFVGIVEALDARFPAPGEGRQPEDRVVGEPIRIRRPPATRHLPPESKAAGPPVRGRPRRPSGRSPGRVAVRAWSRAACRSGP